MLQILLCARDACLAELSKLMQALNRVKIATLASASLASTEGPAL